MNELDVSCETVVYVCATENVRNLLCSTITFTSHSSSFFRSRIAKVLENRYVYNSLR